VRAANRNGNESVGDGGFEEGPKMFIRDEKKIHYLRLKRG
jgi:hypothetical protein